MLKRILTKEEQAKKTQRNQILIGGVLILIMLFSAFAYGFMNRSDDTGTNIVEYKGVAFVFGENSYWNFDYGGLNYATRYNPTELSDISVDLEGLSYQNLQGKVIYTAGEPDDYVLLRNMYQFVTRHGRACLDENCIENAPIKNCSLDYVIIINEINDAIDKENNKTKNNGNYEETDIKTGILKNDKCIYITSDYQNQSRYVDKFFFSLIGLD